MRTGHPPGKGYTLVELAVSMLIFAMLGLAVFSFYAQGVTVWHRLAHRAEVEENLRLAMDRMVREVRESYLISSPSPGKLALTVREITGPVDREDSVVSLVSIEYRLENGQLLRTRKYGTNPVAQYISGAAFHCLPADKPVTVQIKLWGMTSDGKEIFLSGAGSIRSDQ